jgi:hypothetical protein
MSTTEEPVEEKQLEQMAVYQDERVPIREDEFERLPDYVIGLITQSGKGELTPCTHEELTALATTYFTNSVTAVEPAGAGAGAEPSVELNPEPQDECPGGCDPVAAGEVHSSKQ